jgi:dimethylaniline monooxygenase (N-oxide forming)
VLAASISKWSLTTLVQLVEGKLPPELQPEHDIPGAKPAIYSSLIDNIKVGRITPHRASVGKVTATGLSLTNGETIDNLDAIILCTGYDIDYPFISDDCYRSKHSKFMDSPNSLHLYRLTVPRHVRNLFVMGVFRLPGPIQPAVELQGRWVTAILTGRIKLPPAEQMSELIASEEEERGRQVLFFLSPLKEGQIHITHGSPTVLIRSVDPIRPTHRLRPLPPIL